MSKQICSLLTEKDVHPFGCPLSSSLEQRLSLLSPKMCSFTSDVLHIHYVYWISSIWKGCDGPASLFTIKDVCGDIRRYYSIIKNKNKIKYWHPCWWSQKRGEVKRPQLNLQLLLHLNPRDTFLQTPYFFSECRTIHIIYTLLLTYLFEPCRHLTTDEQNNIVCSWGYCKPFCVCNSSHFSDIWERYNLGRGCVE